MSFKNVCFFQKKPVSITKSDIKIHNWKDFMSCVCILKTRLNLIVFVVFMDSM